MPQNQEFYDYDYDFDYYYPYFDLSPKMHLLFSAPYCKPGPLFSRGKIIQRTNQSQSVESSDRTKPFTVFLVTLYQSIAKLSHEKRGQKSFHCRCAHAYVTYIGDYSPIGHNQNLLHASFILGVKLHLLYILLTVLFATLHIFF